MSGSPDGDLIAQAKIVDVSGVQLELVIKGKGRPLLFLHGMDGVEGAAPLIDALSGSFEIFAPSHPGFGASALPRTFGTVDDLAYFYLDLVEQLRLREVVVAGFSFGGWIAAEMLIKDCSRASQVVLGAPLGLPTGDRRRRLATDIFMLDQRDAQARMQVAPLQKGSSEPGEPALLERSVRNADAVSLYGWSPYMCDPKLRQRLHRVKIPALVLWGEQDAIAPVEYGQSFAAALPHASLAVIPNCGHRLYVDHPDAVAQSICNFVETGATAAA